MFPGTFKSHGTTVIALKRLLNFTFEKRMLHSSHAGRIYVYRYMKIRFIHNSKLLIWSQISRIQL